MVIGREVDATNRVSGIGHANGDGTAETQRLHCKLPGSYPRLRLVSSDNHHELGASSAILAL